MPQTFKKHHKKDFQQSEQIRENEHILQTQVFEKVNITATQCVFTGLPVASWHVALGSNSTGHY